ncbi:MAG: hypothetical protein AB2672_08840 [Candidatus Thiodiazotropha endolucinida]
MTTSAPIDDSDYFRKLLRNPPDQNTPGAHLVWMKLMAQVLSDIDTWAPNFAIALSAEYRSLDRLVPYGVDGNYERKFLDGIPHIFSFLSYFLNTDAPLWIKDLFRTETWVAAHKRDMTAERRHFLQQLLSIEEYNGQIYTSVSCDVVSVIQNIIGYRSTTISRVSHLLWMLQSAPVTPVLSPEEKPGIVVFRDGEDGIEMVYAPIDEDDAP